MKNNRMQTDQYNEVELLHLESQQWTSSLNFIKDEIVFIGHLLDSYIFEPDTPNLFERLQDYRDSLKNIISTTSEVCKQISIHDNDLGGMLECKDKSFDQAYCHRHDQLKATVVELMMDFQNFKADIFNYAGGILRKRKPMR
ncbi:hypothetical protein K8352_15915 [Flavobacteriaceae bacterium F89]|uniref:Uncharacterized protein n=1 Tax=Cerina litoralis TaxID=2874477 RepID=A0AAE3EYV5_9FLAO|nr:hypothetical protein [Cerina litoralis]MCG2462247.1 hypothetical protein [Cerina litoralis]